MNIRARADTFCSYQQSCTLIDSFFTERSDLICLILVYVFWGNFFISILFIDGTKWYPFGREGQGWWCKNFIYYKNNENISNHNISLDGKNIFSSPVVTSYRRIGNNCRKLRRKERTKEILKSKITRSYGLANAKCYRRKAIGCIFAIVYRRWGDVGTCNSVKFHFGKFVLEKLFLFRGVDRSDGISRREMFYSAISRFILSSVYVVVKFGARKIEARETIEKRRVRWTTKRASLWQRLKRIRDDAEWERDATSTKKSCWLSEEESEIDAGVEKGTARECEQNRTHDTLNFKCLRIIRQEREYKREKSFFV